jgi:hypothetical protein
VIPFLVFMAYLAVHRELGRLREMMIPAGTLIALLIVAPWYVALYQQHGWTYITGFFIDENVGRFTETIGVQERGPFFYLPVVFHDMLPWSLCRHHLDVEARSAQPAGPVDSAPDTAPVVDWRDGGTVLDVPDKTGSLHLPDYCGGGRAGR